MLVLLAVGAACCATAERTTHEDDSVLTARKCCSATGELFYLAADQLGNAVAPPGDVTKQTLPEPPAHATFHDFKCEQGSQSSKSWGDACRTKSYVFAGFTVKINQATTWVHCPASWGGRCNAEDTWKSLVATSEHDRAQELRCPADSTQHVPEACQSRPLVAIFADYDDCWDIISATNPLANPAKFNGKFLNSYENVSGVLRTKIKEITHGKRVILFVGSKRQSWRDDQVHAQTTGNGLALGKDNAFERWLQEFGSGPAGCWELNKALLSDKEKGGKPCSSWDKERVAVGTSPWMSLEQEAQQKTDLLENAIKQLLLEDHVDLYFFDDHAVLLQYVRSTAWIPSNMRLYTIRYKWQDFAEGTRTEPLNVIASD